MPRTRAEIGAVGLPLFSGYLSLDPNKRLRGREGIAIYREMSHDEPAATAFLSAAYQLLRTDFQVESGGATDNDKAAAEFLEQCVGDMRDSAATCARQMYSIIWAGWDVHELVYKRRSGGWGSRYDDGRVGWAAWALRRQETLERWDTDPNGRTSGFVQRPAPSFTLRTIPLAKTVHAVADDGEGSPEGRSALRGMYRQWYFVKNFEILMGISLERFGTGLPAFKVKEGVTLSDGDEQRIMDIIAALRQNEEAGVLLPGGVDLTFLSSPGLTATDYRETIQYMRVWMLATGLADFIALGSGKTGSYALGRDKSELFLLALNGYQDRLLSALNRQAVPRLFRYNDFGNLTDLPRLNLPAVRRYDLEGLAKFTTLLQKVGALHITPEDEEMFRRISDLVDLPPEVIAKLHAQDQQPSAATETLICPACGMENDPEAVTCANCGAVLPQTNEGEAPVGTGQDKNRVEQADEAGTDEEEVAVSETEDTYA